MQDICFIAKLIVMKIKAEFQYSRYFIIIDRNLACSLSPLLAFRGTISCAYIAWVSCIRLHATFHVYIKFVQKKKDREMEREKERQRDTREGPTTRSHIKDAYLCITRRRHLHMCSYQYRQTARPIYSTTLFSTISRHGSTFYATIIPFATHEVPSQR